MMLIRNTLVTNDSEEIKFSIVRDNDIDCKTNDIVCGVDEIPKYDYIDKNNCIGIVKCYTKNEYKKILNADKTPFKI